MPRERTRRRERNEVSICVPAPSFLCSLYDVDDDGNDDDDDDVSISLLLFLTFIILFSFSSDDGNNAELSRAARKSVKFGRGQRKKNIEVLPPRRVAPRPFSPLALFLLLDTDTMTRVARPSCCGRGRRRGAARPSRPRRTRDKAPP